MSNSSYYSKIGTNIFILLYFSSDFIYVKVKTFIKEADQIANLKRAVVKKPFLLYV